MSQLTEIIANKNMVDIKIAELRAILVSEQDEDIAKKLMSLLDDRQNLLISIHRANITSKISIGSADIDIATAIIIRDSIEDKFICLSELITNKECVLDKLKLMEQRDRYFDEHTLIDMGIQRNDLNVMLS